MKYLKQNFLAFFVSCICNGKAADVNKSLAKFMMYQFLPNLYQVSCIRLKSSTVVNEISVNTQPFR